MHTLLRKIQTTSILNLLTLLFAVTFLVYCNTLLNGLFFDDQQFIYENQAVQNFTISDFFTQSLTTGGGQLSNYYRPLLFTSFSLEYQLFGANGFIYHFSSLIIHICGGIVLFLFLHKLFKSRSLALLTSTLWLIHPIQTEAVSYASGRGDPLSFFFVILTLYLSLFSSTKIYIAALCTLVLALLSKELALVTPFLLFITRMVVQKNSTTQTLFISFKKAFPFFIIAGSYFLLRLTVLNFADTLNFYNGENIYSGSLYVRLLTFFELLPQYLSLLLFPKDLYMERDSNISIQATLSVISVLSFLGVLFLSIFSLVKRKSFPLLFFSVAWFGISFLPTMGIIPINGIFYEHFLYYPSVGFFLLCSYLFIKLYKKVSSLWQNILLIFLLGIFCLLGLRTISRNAEWRDAITFYEQTLTFAKSARIYNNVAMSYAESGQPEKAITAYTTAISLSDTYPETHYNLGNTYRELKKYKEAESSYKKALELSPYFYLSYIQLFNLYTMTENKKGQAYVTEEVEKLAEENSSFLPLLKQLRTHP